MYLLTTRRVRSVASYFRLNSYKYFLFMFIVCELPNVFDTTELPNSSAKQFFNAQKHPSLTDRRHKKSILPEELDYKAIYKRDDSNGIESNAKLESIVTEASQHNSGGKYILKSNYTFFVLLTYFLIS